MVYFKKSRRNYCFQLKRYVQIILESGLLLDEDMDCVFAYYQAENEYNVEQKLTYLHTIVNAVSLASTFFIIKCRYPISLVAISASPLVVFGLQRLSKLLYRRGQTLKIERLMQSLLNIYKMNRLICEYFKLRNTSNTATEDILSPYTECMKQLMALIFNEETSLLDAFKVAAREFFLYVPSLQVAYAHLENIELGQFNTDNVHCINDCVIFLQKLCDIYVLMVSNCLTCLAISICPTVCFKHDIDVDKVLDITVFQMKSVAVTCYMRVNKKFDDIKYYHLKRKKSKEPHKPSTTSAISKLHLGTCNMMAQTSDILEKSQIILEKLQQHNLESASERKVLCACIAQLRNQVFDYYQSLDVLHELYEININKSETPFQFAKPLSAESSTQSSVVIKGVTVDTSFNASEPSEDEEYELYIGANEIPCESADYNYCDEQESRKYASMLSQELKLKLKSHSKFIAARKKRGIFDEDCENTNVEHETVKVENLELPSSAPTSLADCEFQNTNFDAPPPPPPPLPPIDLTPSEGMVGSPYEVSSIDDMQTDIYKRFEDYRRTCWH